MDDTCRTCMDRSKKNKMSVFDFANVIFANGTKKNIQINNLLVQLIPVLPAIELNDTLSKKICLECTKKVVELFEFSISCIQSDLLARQQPTRNDIISIVDGDTIDIKEEVVEDFTGDANDTDADTIDIKEEVVEDLTGDANDTDADIIDIKEEVVEDLTGHANDTENLTEIAEAKECIVTTTETDSIVIVKEEIYAENVEDNQDHHEEANAEQKTRTDVWRCGNCSKEFIYRHAFIKHLKLNNKDGECVKKKQERLKCFFCTTTFVFKDSLQKHMKKIHNIDTQMKIPTGEYKCSRCLVPFLSREELYEHMLEDHRENTLATYSSKTSNNFANLMDKSALNSRFNESDDAAKMSRFKTQSNPPLLELANEFSVHFLAEDDKTKKSNINMTPDELRKDYIEQLIQESYHKSKPKKRYRIA